MYICIYVCVCVCVYIYIYIYTCVCVCVCVCVSLCLCVGLCLWYVYVCISVSVWLGGVRHLVWLTHCLGFTAPRLLICSQLCYTLRRQRLKLHHFWYLTCKPC